MKRQNKTEPIRILHFVPSMRAAGIETFIMNLYRHIDRSKIQFDFVVHTTKKQIYDDEIEQLGGKIYHLTYKDDKNFLKYINNLNQLFSKHPEYKIVHGNMQSMMPIYLHIAKKHNVPIRIAHAHNNGYEKTLKGFLLHVLSRFAKYESTNNFACSDEAGKYLFGNRNFTFIPNFIDAKKFRFDNNARMATRRKLGIADDELLIGHIGRFDLQKNHRRLIEIFNVEHQNNPKTKLCLVGVGKLKNDVESQVERLNLTANVLFLGQRTDTPELYSAMDVFMLPSLYEGLGIVAIEAQANGLPCIISDTVASQAILTKDVIRISLNKPDEEWVAHIPSTTKSTKTRTSNYQAVEQSAFNITKGEEIITTLYEQLLKNQEN